MALDLYLQSGALSDRKRSKNRGLGKRCAPRHCPQESCARCVEGRWWRPDRSRARLAAEISGFPIFDQRPRPASLTLGFFPAPRKRHRAPDSAASCLLYRVDAWVRHRVCHFGEQRQPSSPGKAGEVDGRREENAFADALHILRNKQAGNRTSRHKKRQKASHHSGKEPSPTVGS